MARLSAVPSVLYKVAIPYYNDNELVTTINKDGFLAMAGSAKDPVSIAPERSADESQFQVSQSQVDETTQKETGFKNATFNLKWFYLHSYYKTADDAEPVEYVLDFDAPQFSITIANLSITITGAKVGDRFAIFDMQGGVTRTGTIKSNGNTVTVPRTGVYIVRVNNQVRKVNLR